MDIVAVICGVFVGAFMISLIGMLLFIVYAKIRRSRVEWLSIEKNFDEEYFEKRKNWGLKLKYVWYPFEDIKTIKFKELSFVKDASVSFSWYDKVAEYDVHALPYSCLGIFRNFIFENYDAFKDFNNPLNHKLFEQKPLKIKYWDEEEDRDIRTIVKNILTFVPSCDLLTFLELVQIACLLNEVIVNCIIDDLKKYDQLIKIIKGQEYENPEWIVKHRVISEDLHECKMLFIEAFSKQFDIKVNVYDSRFNVSMFEIKNISYGPENPLKEMNVLNSENFCYNMTKPE